MYLERLNKTTKVTNRSFISDPFRTQYTAFQEQRRYTQLHSLDTAVALYVQTRFDIQ